MGGNVGENEEVEEGAEAVAMPEGARRLLLSVTGVSIVWVILAIAAALSYRCAPGKECLGLNEWGDFLAGAFAPLAFVWLAVAVVLQTAELREQRRELVLTRAEFKHNRKVMKAQAEEAGKQAAFIGTQIHIMEAVEQDKALSTHFALLRSWCVGRWNPKSGYYLTHDSPTDDQGFFVELTRRLLVAAADKEEGANIGKWNLLMDGDPGDLLYVCERIRVIASKESQVSPAMKTLLQASGASKVVWQVVHHLPRPGLALMSQFPEFFPYGDDENNDD